MGSGNSSGASAWGLILLLLVDELRNVQSDAAEDAAPPSFFFRSWAARFLRRRRFIAPTETSRDAPRQCGGIASSNEL